MFQRRTTPTEQTQTAPSIHRKITLSIDTDSFVLTGGNDIVEIDLDTGNLSVKDDYMPTPTTRHYEIYGIIGFIKLLSNNYIIVITNRRPLGQIQGKTIYAITRIAVVPFEYEEACRVLDRRVVREVDEDLSSTSDTFSIPIPSHGRVTSEDVDPATIMISERELSSTPESTTPLSQSLSTDITETKVMSTDVMSSRPSRIEAFRQPVNSLFARMKSAFTKRPSSAASDTSDDADKDGLFESVTISETVVFRQVTPEGEYKEDEDDKKECKEDENDKKGFGAAAKRLTVMAWDGLKNEVVGVRDVVGLNNVSDFKILDERIIKEIVLLFRGESFYFSYDYDLTTSLQQKEDKLAACENVPLWKQMTKHFWWNESMLQCLIDMELHSWILPIMQGYVQIELCEIENLPFYLILISRRSRERAGLRYQRRGVNEQGHVANFVETEQILLTTIDDVPNVVSFLQVRGSMPLFWSQSPYGLKPKPVLERKPKDNELAIATHFRQLIEQYGTIVCISLTESTGREQIIGSAYQEAVANLNNDNIEFVEFDFHRECRGMKYENISNLIGELENKFSAMGYFWKAEGSPVHCRQTGIFRTNCMDCLDRTNVVQSALARHVLILQLLRFGIPEILDNGVSHYDAFENIFNDVWANNGDSISREYAGTSALKSDFTRTGKRNIQGMVNDASNSLARMYQNTFRDFFRQATIDYLLGHRSVEVFEELQRRFETSEPGEEDRWAKIRATAIEISSSIVIYDNEVKSNGWTFLSPSEPNAKRSKSYEEKVLLLTDKALYICTYHYGLEKIIQFVRIGLGEIQGIVKGEYILTTLYTSCTTVDDNYGLVIYYCAAGESTRLNSGSIRNNADPHTADDEETKFIAFKAFRSNIVGEATKFDSGAGGDHITGTQTAKQVVNEVVSEIVTACQAIGNHRESFVVEQPIISFAEANKNTGIMTKVGFQVKRALWL